MGIGYDRGQEAEQKQVEIMEDRRDKGKEVNMAAGDSDDALVKNTVEDRIMDSSASFHATYCKEELERFKLRSDKVRLADDMTLSMQHWGWLPRRLRRPAVKVTKGSLVVARGNKCGSLYMVEISTSVSQVVWRSIEYFLHNVKEDKDTAETAIGVAVENGIVMLKMVLETPMQFGVCFICFPFALLDLAMALHLLHQSEDPATMILLSKTAAEVAIAAQMKCDTAFGIRRVTRLSKAEILHLRTQFMEPGRRQIQVA
ncbi:hypothetical protein Tco_1277567 [Tanacetum coccineum]